MKPVLLLHGALGSKSQLELLKGSLEKEGLHIFSMNFSGHSGTPFQQSFGIETFSADIAKFIHEQALSQVDIFGYSMGGYAALWLAHQHPELISKIVTLGTKYDWSEPSAEKEIRKLNADKILEKVPAFARILEHRHSPNDWKLLLEKTAAMMRELGKKPLLTEDIVRKINHQTLILQGDQDDMADLVYSKKIAGLLSNGSFAILESTPHPIEKVNVRDLTNLLKNFFKS